MRLMTGLALLALTTTPALSLVPRCPGSLCQREWSTIDRRLPDGGHPMGAPPSPQSFAQLSPTTITPHPGAQTNPEAILSNWAEDRLFELFFGLPIGKVRSLQTLINFEFHA